MGSGGPNNKSSNAVAPIPGNGDTTTPSLTTPVPPPTATVPPPAAVQRPAITLLQPPSQRKRSNSKSAKVSRLFRSVFRSFPIITAPSCRLPTYLPGNHTNQPSTSDSHLLLLGGRRVTGTLFGYRKGRVSLAIQDNPRCLPEVVIELALQTNVLLKEMSTGLVRIALECDKRPERTALLDEPLWTIYCNGRKSGYGVRREPNDEDLNVMQLLQAVSMGAGVLPGLYTSNNALMAAAATSSGAGTGVNSMAVSPVVEVQDPNDFELAYMRAHFERVVGSRDSEAFYMLNPDGSNGPELSIFMVRI